MLGLHMGPDALLQPTSEHCNLLLIGQFAGVAQETLETGSIVLHGLRLLELTKFFKGIFIDRGTESLVQLILHLQPIHVLLPGLGPLQPDLSITIKVVGGQLNLLVVRRLLVFEELLH